MRVDMVEPYFAAIALGVCRLDTGWSLDAFYNKATIRVVTVGRPQARRMLY